MLSEERDNDNQLLLVPQFDYLLLKPRILSTKIHATISSFLHMFKTH